MFDFFIDTADIDYIRNLTPAIEDYRKNVKGITTNPNAMDKIRQRTLAEWQSTLPDLCKLVSEIRGDDQGEVHVQAPNSEMTGQEVLAFAQHIHKFNDGQTKLALKIAPKADVLEVVGEIQKLMPVNVTGLADCGTALSCMTYGVDYVSIIPGRMEEVGIVADDHLKFLLKRNSDTKVITGSMRTIDGLARAVKYDTIPTIGTRVWDKIANKSLDIGTLSEQDPLFSPHIDSRNTDLSVSFFHQMDALGMKAYEEFVKEVNSD